MAKALTCAKAVVLMSLAALVAATQERSYEDWTAPSIAPFSRAQAATYVGGHSGSSAAAAAATVATSGGGKSGSQHASSGSSSPAGVAGATSRPRKAVMEAAPAPSSHAQPSAVPAGLSTPAWATDLLRGMPALKLPKLGQGVPSGAAQAPLAGGASPPAASGRPATPSPAPAPAPSAAITATEPSADTTGACSRTEASADAVFRCVNAVRVSPRDFTDGFDCNWSAWIDGVASPARSALRADGQLTQSAERQAEDMARTGRMTHQGSDGSTMAQRIAATGFTGSPLAENVAAGQRSAFEVTMAWMCSDSGHRETIMSCGLDSVGTATAYAADGRAYFDQDFGCLVRGSCRC